MLSIIVPTYNEKENIGLLIAQLEKSISQEHEIIVVDDNSPDGTADVVRSLSKEFPSLRLIKRRRKQGLTSAIVAGAKAAAGNDVVVMDADLSHPPERAAALASELKNHDLVIGSRNVEGGGVQNWPLHRKLVSKCAEMLAHILLGISSRDPLSGFFAIKRNVLLRTRFRTKGYKILLNILFDNPDLRIKEIPYLFRDRHAGKTKLGTAEIVNYVFDLLRIKL